MPRPPRRTDWSHLLPKPETCYKKMPTFFLNYIYIYLNESALRSREQKNIYTPSKPQVLQCQDEQVLELLKVMGFCAEARFFMQMQYIYTGYRGKKQKRDTHDCMSMHCKHLVSVHVFCKYCMQGFPLILLLRLGSH